MFLKLVKLENKINVIIEYNLYLLVFLLPIQTRLILRAGEINGGYLEYLTISLYGVDILLFLLLMLFVFIKFKNSTFNIRHLTFGYWYIIGALDLFIFISIFFATDIWLALYRYGLFLLGVGLFWLAASADYSRIKLIWALLAGFVCQAGLGIWQFFTQFAFGSKWLGLARHSPADLGASVIELIAPDGVGERWLRAYGGLDHPNVLGGVLVIGILLILSLLIRNSKNEILNSKQIQNPKSKYRNLILFTFYFLLFTSLFFSFSRTAWLAAIAGIILMLVLTVIRKNWLAQRELLIIILISGFLTFGLYSQYGNLVKTRFSGDTRLEAMSSGERIEYIGEAKEIIKKNWLFGGGIGNYSLASKELNDSQVKDEGGKNYFLEAKKQAWAYQPVHNVFLLVWAEIGIVGLLGFLGLLGYLGWSALKRFWKEEDYISLPLLLALVIIMMFDHWLWSLHFGVLWFWLILGLIVKQKSPEVIYRK